MERIPHFWQNSLIKIVIISGLALLMLIPLSMIRKQVDERSAHHEQAESDITDNWGCGQTFTGPWIVYDLPNGKNKIYELLPEESKKGDILPFTINLRVNGSTAMYFTPLGSLTEVLMTSNFPDPSFIGEFLPTEREVRSDGFSAKWLVSQITMENPSSCTFGVRMVKPVTQYRKTERATKYGILIIFLVFIAGFVVEIISKKPINIIQYLIIGASLVLFYSLLLAFSDFLSFGLSYLIASTMTTVALGGYFIGIVKNKWAYLLTGLVALSYGIVFILLQMETFAFLTGTLVLFIILCVIMVLTRNMAIEKPSMIEGQKSL